MVGYYPGGMTDNTLLPGEEYCKCDDCYYDGHPLCPYKHEINRCNGNIDDIDEIINERLDAWCNGCENEDGCEYKKRTECYLETRARMW